MAGVLESERHFGDHELHSPPAHAVVSDTALAVAKPVAMFWTNPGHPADWAAPFKAKSVTKDSELKT